VHVNRAAVCWQLRQCHISKFVSLKFKQKDSSFARKQSNFCLFPHVTTISAQHSVPLKGCVPDAMLAPSTQRVTQVTATYSSFPDIALNPQAPPSRCGQILIDSIGGSPIANRIQWVADRSSIGSLFNHPFVVEIRVLVFNACCKDRLRNSTIITHLYGYYSILYMKTCITQIFTYYANIVANMKWTCNGLGTHLCCNLALRMRHHSLR